jgi:alginate O-acetyltransferase complex protein AlgI
MLFNSFAFLVFIVLVFILYWFVFNKTKLNQNLLLLLASYLFYGWWNWKFLFLLLSLSVANYFAALIIQKSGNPSARKKWLIVVILLNLGTLFWFKYFNFFIDSFIELLSLTGLKVNFESLKIILPVGISFYTFLGLSYIIDVYRKNLAASINIIEVLLSLSFFPILLAGPIQRPISLLPQINQRRLFIYDKAVDGLRQILWGLFMKVVIADHMSGYVNIIFINHSAFTGSTSLVGAVLFTVQIYCDFAGYSNMAIGISRLLGFDIMQNFATPYFSRNITDFWKRWHISLTEWFRDYLFLPIAFFFSRRFPSEKILFINTNLLIYSISVFITWFLIGLWHGANYTFIIWGMIHATLLIYHNSIKKQRKKLLKLFGVDKRNLFLVFIESSFTLIMVIVSWIFFKSSNISIGFDILKSIFSASLFSIPDIFPKKFIVVSCLFFVSEWIQRSRNHVLQFMNNSMPVYLRWSFYLLLLFMVIYWGGTKNDFIYFQF